MQTKSVISKKPGMTVTTDVKAGFFKNEKEKMAFERSTPSEQFEFLRKQYGKKS